MAVTVYKKYCKNNDCYKAGAKRGTITGLVVHTPAVIDQGATIRAMSGSGGGWYKRWNRPGVEKLADGVIDDTGVYDFAPHTLNCWHVGNSYGNGHFIGYEFCEILDRTAFNKTWNNAVQHYANLCKTYGLGVNKIYGHCEAHDKGWASNHSDPLPFFRRFGKNMNDFRADVQKILNGGSTSQSSTSTSSSGVAKAYNPWAYARVCNLTASDPLLNVRSGAGTNYGIIGRLSNGNEVDVIETYTNGWAKINIVGTIGYVYAGYLNISERAAATTPAKEEPKGYASWVGEVYNTGRVGLIVRRGPGKNYGRLAAWPKLSDTNLVSVEGESGNWYIVKIASKYVGYVCKDYIKHA